MITAKQLERILRERDEEKGRESDQVLGGVFMFIIIVVIIGVGIYFLVDFLNNKSKGGSSSSTDWNAYCRDMFPDNDEYSRSAREGCINGATASGITL